MAASTKPVFCWQERRAMAIGQATTSDGQNENDQLCLNICPEIFCMYLSKYIVSTIYCTICMDMPYIWSHMYIYAHTHRYPHMILA